MNNEEFNFGQNDFQMMEETDMFNPDQQYVSDQEFLMNPPYMNHPQYYDFEEDDRFP